MDTAHSSLDDKYPPEMWQHMARIEQFSTGNDDSTYVSKFYGQDLIPDRLQPHRGVLMDIASKGNTAVKTVQGVVNMLSGDKGKQLRYLLPKVAKHVKIAVTIPDTSYT